VKTENGQNGPYVKRMRDDLYAEVPGQLSIDDMNASAEDIAAAEAADGLVKAILAGERPELPGNVVQLNARASSALRTPPGRGCGHYGAPFQAFPAARQAFRVAPQTFRVPPQSSGVDTPTSVEKSIAGCGTIASVPCSTPEEC
jgi:hypothetical protein